MALAIINGSYLLSKGMLFLEQGKELVENWKNCDSSPQFRESYYETAIKVALLVSDICVIYEVSREKNIYETLTSVENDISVSGSVPFEILALVAQLALEVFKGKTLIRALFSFRSYIRLGSCIPIIGSFIETREKVTRVGRGIQGIGAIVRLNISMITFGLLCQLGSEKICQLTQSYLNQIKGRKQIERYRTEINTYNSLLADKLRTLTLPPKDLNYEEIPSQYENNAVFHKYVCPINRHPIRYPVIVIVGKVSHYFELKKIHLWLIDHTKNPIDGTSLFLRDICIDKAILTKIEDEMNRLLIPLERRI